MAKPTVRGKYGKEMYGSHTDSLKSGNLMLERWCWHGTRVRAPRYVMLFKRVFSKRAPTLEEVLRRPQRYTDKQIRRCIKREVAYWYHHDESKMLAIHSCPDTERPTYHVVTETIAREVARGQLSDATAVKDAFMKLFDNALLPCYRNGAYHKRRLDEFYYVALRWVPEQDKLSEGLPPGEERLDAYRMAFAKLTKRMRGAEFTFTKSAAALMSRIYSQCCIERIRHRDSDVAFLHRSSVDIASLSPEARRRLTAPPHSPIGDLRQLFKRQHTRCFELLDKLDQGYSYRDLAAEFGNLKARKPAEQLRKTASRCRKKFDDLNKTLRHE